MKIASQVLFYLSLISYLVLSWNYFHIWDNPQPADINVINKFSSLIILEFFLVHSGLFMAVFSKSRLALIILIIIYGIIIISIGGTGFLWIYSFTLINRIKKGIITIVQPDTLEFDILDISQNVIRSFSYAMLYFFTLSFVMIYAEEWPTLGLTENFLHKAGYYVKYGPKDDSIFHDSPHLPLAIGCIYFALVPILQLFWTLREWFKNRY